MITRCDHCGSKFEVSAELVNSADPGVRCGECLALFDARANLYNEAEYRKSAAMLRPVQKRKPEVKEVETIDADMLETADTIAVEHIYTSAGVKNTELGKERNKPDDYSLPDRQSSGQSAEQNTETEQRYHQPGYHQSGHGQTRDYSANKEYATDFEFERTLATESALPDRTDLYDRKDELPESAANYAGNTIDTNYRDAYRSAPVDLSDDLPDQKLPDQKNPAITRDRADTELPVNARDNDSRKRQKLRDQEQRALQIEPERDFSALSSVDIALDQSMSEQRRTDFYRQEIERRRVGDRSRIDDRDLAHDSRIVNRRDTHFVPDDVVSRPGIIRDNGRRPEEATRFKPDTPEFDISLDDDDHLGSKVSERIDAPGGRERLDQSLPAIGSKAIEPELTDQVAIGNSDNARSEKSRNVESAAKSDQERIVTEARGDEETRSINNKIGDEEFRRPLIEGSPGEGERHRLNKASRDVKARAPSADVPPAHKSPAQKSSAHESSAHESSAQEMRRYQQYRPTVDVEHVAEDELLTVDDERKVERQQRTVTTKQSSAGLLFWAAGLVLAIGLLLFAARGMIANMNLPEPVITVFCQVTGCVPDQAKKNVDQLHTMRKRLYPHPEIENAIVISVDVVNNSIYKQPLPTLAVRLLNESDEIVAERDFNNTSYEVVDGSESGFLLPDEPTRLKIEVVDTGLAAADVELGFK